MRRLVIRPGAIGDVVCSLPAIEYLEPAEVWAPAPVLPLLRHIAPARSIASTGIDRLEIPGLPVEEVVNRLSCFDEIVSWYGSNRAEFRAAVAGHALNVRFLPALPGKAGEEEIAHAADYFLRAVGAAPGGIPRLPFRGAPEPFAAIHPFSGSPKKNWPINHFQDLASRLQSDLHVQWCAGPEEELHGAHRFQDLAEVGAWLSKAAIYIGNDSGISHMAAACGVPVIAMFGPTDPRIWAPRGEQVRIFPFTAPVEAIARAAVRMARAPHTS